ncbi:trypsin-1-like [Palaemon carinicauda]|uniref:trypsin-1-like n=1 Tax=Palaemon carinicauda TaxID=392227 RepID=UPI0035B65E19
MRRVPTCIFVLAALVVSEAAKITKIIGGRDAYLGEIPYIVSLQDIRYGTHNHVCGGVIYSNSFVLTVAHCVANFQPSEIRIVAGELDLNTYDETEQIVFIDDIVKHQDYDPSTFVNDIAILKLRTPLEFNSFVQPIEIFSQGTPTGTCMMSGWGATQELGDPYPILQKVNLPIWADDACKDAYYSFYFPVSDNNICAGELDGGRDACSADDGGPLVCESGSKLVGMASWGNGCGRQNQPGVYVEVSYFKTWIENIAGRQ